MNPEELRAAKISFAITALAMLWITTFIFGNNSNASNHFNQGRDLCYWNLTYHSDKVLDNTQIMGIKGYPTISLPAGAIVETYNCPVDYREGSNGAWIDPSLPNDRFGAGQYIAGKTIMPGQYAPLASNEKTISCSNDTHVKVLGSKQYMTTIRCAPNAVGYLTKIN